MSADPRSGDAIRVSPRGGGGGTSPATRGGPNLPDLGVRSELLVLAAAVLAVLIAAAVADGFGAERAWTLVTVLAAAYILSRGLARHEHPRGHDHTH